MPLCRIQTSNLTYRELYRIGGLYGFPIMGPLKLIRCDFPNPGRYLMPCYWGDMHVAPETLSAEVLREVAAVHATLPKGEGSWEGHCFQRPHQASLIADSGGALFFAPGAEFSVMFVYARSTDSFTAAYIYVGSFRQDGHSIATTNNLRGFDPVPGSQCHAVRGSLEDLMRQHQIAISVHSDLAIFDTFAQLTAAYDRKEKLQSDWDIARGAYVPTDAA